MPPCTDAVGWVLRVRRGPTSAVLAFLAVVAWIHVITLALGGSGALAQEGKTIPVDPEHPYTLHVYEDLVQVPSLVLNSLHGSYRGLKPENFYISLDSGPRFHPKHIRLEGDDPIALTFLLDGSDPLGNPQIKALDAAVSRLPLDLLGPQDRISVFAFNCRLVRSAFNQPASHSMLQAGIVAAMTSPSLQESPPGQPCRKRVGLWDAIGVVVREAQAVPGRRAVIVLSPGIDYGSNVSWEAVRLYAGVTSTAIIGLQPSTDPASVPAGPNSVRVLFRPEDPFGMLCNGSGGIGLVASTQSLSGELRRAIDMLRNRYILEFPRPANGTAGRHDMAVSITDKKAIVHTSGIAVPLPDQVLLSDPSTVPTDTSQSPVMGSRRILEPH